jgi:hypothetical protein
MNFAYLDARSIFETMLTPPSDPPPPPIPFELPEHWNEFEDKLGNYKLEFVKTRADLTKKLASLTKKKEETNVLKMMLENVESQGLKERLSSMIDDYEHEEGLDDLTRQCGEAAGKVEAMKKVLMDTHVDKYAKFTCFVCMDRMVELFIDPCGHVICDACWARTTNKTMCPGCRNPAPVAKKIFCMAP